MWHCEEDQHQGQQHLGPLEGVVLLLCGAYGGAKHLMPLVDVHSYNK